MYFTSDNAGPAHPAVMEALARANTGYAAGYGNDSIMDEVRTLVRDAFEAPEAAVYLVATGTATNSLLLATMVNPWETVFCADVAHIQEDECNAPEFFMDGSKLTLIQSEDSKITPARLREKMTFVGNGIHSPQRGALSITQATEKGTVYSLDEIRALTAVARDFGVGTHMDGARFTNALVSLGCTPAEMTWKAGVDTLSFGGTKNGLMGVEAAVIFDPAKAQEFEFRRKRGGHLFSKHRYLSAQMQAYLTDGLWLDLAGRANAACARLAAGLKDKGLAPDFEPQANLLFFTAPQSLHDRLHAAGAHYYLWDSTDTGADPMVTGRLVCDWTVTEETVDRFLSLL